MSYMCRIMEIEHSMQSLRYAFYPLGYLSVACFVSLIIAGIIPTIEFPLAFWVSCFVAIPATLIKSLLQYKLSDASLKEMVAGAVARNALLFVKIVAAYKGIFSSEIKWERTPKFECDAGPSIAFALCDTKLELLIGLALAAFGYLPIAFVDVLGFQMTGLLCTLFLSSSVPFFCAPTLALVREYSKHSKEELKRSASDVFPLHIHQTVVKRSSSDVWGTHDEKTNGTLLRRVTTARVA